MADWWTSLSLWDQIYWGCAILASILLMLVFIMSILGTDSEFDLEDGMDLDSSGFLDYSIISAKSILSFFVMFGWAGILFGKTALGSNLVFILAFACGLAALFMVGYFTQFLQNLSESGTFKLEKILNKTATVYLTIPGEKKDKGKVHIVIEGSLKEFDAWTEGQMIPNGDIVEITSLNKEGEVTVKPIIIK